MTQTHIDATSHSRGRSAKRKALMMSCASAALAVTALIPQAARAQAFRGTITGSTGSVNRVYPTTIPQSETIVIGSNTATINWSPNNQQAGGGTIDFLPNGSIATFTSTQGITDYTVLNRIIPQTGQPISLNGHVISTLQGTNTTGGKVWFYSPGGIVVGASAVFDVGGLLLTTNDVTSFSNMSNSFNATFGAPGSATSRVQIAPGAQINALAQGSYVAIVAPRIEQGGKVRVNGSAAYAAGEQLTMTMNQGLFDIAVNVGTGDSNGVVHTGETSGPANVAATDNHSIYMVAVPKNQALTMLLGGKVGFDDATSATVENGQIILASGLGVRVGSDGKFRYRVTNADLQSGIQIAPGTYTSDLHGVGTGPVEVNANTGDATFGGDLALESWSRIMPVSVSLQASNGHHLSVAGNLGLYSEDFGTGDGSGWISIGAYSGGSVSVAGTTYINPAEGSNGTTYANNVSLYAADGGAITTGSTTIDAWAFGGDSTEVGGDGYGGDVDIEAWNGGSIQINGDLIVNAVGTGGNGTVGGNGYGGDTSLYLDGGSLNVTGDFTVQSNGIGGNGTTGGDGYGGYVFAELTSLTEGLSEDASLHVGGDLSLQASGTGGNGVDNPTGAGGAGGNGYAGDAYVYIDPNLGLDSSTSVTFANGEIFANGTGGSGGSGLTGGSGGNGCAYYCYDGGEGSFAGSVTLYMYGGTLTSPGDLLVYSTSRGGNGGAGSAGLGGNGGDAYGGDATIYVGGNLNAGRALSYGRAFGGNGGAGTTSGTGGYAQGGYASIEVFAGGHLTGNVDISTNAYGGLGYVGGDASGGYSSLYVEGTLTGGSLLMESNAFGGAGITQGGYADSGYADLSVVTGTATLSGNGQIHADALGGNAQSGTGGDAQGYYADVNAYGGGSLTGGSLVVTSNATGGNGSAAGAARGGEASVRTNDYDENPTSIAFDSLTLSANGNLGSGTVNDGQYGFGGYIYLSASGGTISADTLALQANGTTDGGNIWLDSYSYSDAASHLQFGSVNALANGADTGGDFYIFTGSGGTIDLGDAELRANGGFGGSIAIYAGCDFCGADQNGSNPKSAVLPAGGGITATDLTLATTGNIYVELNDGADVAASGTLEMDAGQQIQLYDPNGTGGAIRGHIIDLAATTIDANARLIGDIIRMNASAYMNVGNLNASQSASFTAGSLVDFNGTVDSPTITVTSGDINISDGASLGVNGHTNLITLNALSSGQPVLIGDAGDSEEGQYVLDEDGDIHTAALVINAQGGEGGADVHIFDVAIEGSQTNGGGIGDITVNAGGSILVNGFVDFTNAGANDSLTLHAGNILAVNTDAGGIQITDSAGRLSGTLTLTADNIWVASETILEQLLQDVNFTGRDEALGTNSGTPNQDGFVRAGTIRANVGNTFLVQNSGTPELFGGIDTGNGGLSIDGTGDTPVTVIAYGRRTNNDGTVITNQDFLGGVEFSGNGGFTDGSAVNGCSITGTCGGGGVEEPPITIDMATILGPLDQASGNDESDKNDDEDDADDDNEDGSKVDPSLRLINTTPINLDQQIDDPVTSGGDVVIGNPTN